MSDHWIMRVPFAATICDTKGVILEMNEKAIATFAKYGGAALIGKSLLDCHPPAARAKLAELLAEPRANAYTIEKQGVCKLIYQAPWYDGAQFGGLVELAIELPSPMPHFVREP